MEANQRQTERNGWNWNCIEKDDHTSFVAAECCKPNKREGNNRKKNTHTIEHWLISYWCWANEDDSWLASFDWPWSHAIRAITFDAGKTEWSDWFFFRLFFVPSHFRYAFLSPWRTCYLPPVTFRAISWLLSIRCPLHQFVSVQILRTEKKNIIVYHTI